MSAAAKLGDILVIVAALWAGVLMAAPHSKCVATTTQVRR